MEIFPLDDDLNNIPQITGNFFPKSEYIFHLDSTNNYFDNIIAHAQTNTKAYEPFFKTFYHCVLTFNFLDDVLTR